MREYKDQEVNLTDETRPVTAGTEIKQVPVYERVVTATTREFVTEEALLTQKAALENELAPINEALEKIQAVKPKG